MKGLTFLEPSLGKRGDRVKKKKKKEKRKKRRIWRRIKGKRGQLSAFGNRKPRRHKSTAKRPWSDARSLFLRGGRRKEPIYFPRDREKIGKKLFLEVKNQGGKAGGHSEEGTLYSISKLKLSRSISQTERKGEGAFLRESRKEETLIGEEQREEGW